MNIVFLSMMYGFGMPIIPCLALVALCISYVVEKIAIFWHVKKPPMFDDELSQNALRYMKWAAALYPSIGFYMLSN